MVEVIKHQSKPFTYIVSNGAIMIGELVEDDIANFLSKRRFGKICNVKGTTIDKYIENPYMLRYYHMRRIAKFLNIDVRDIIDIIEIDLPEGELSINGEEDFTLIDAMPSKYKQKNLKDE
jgi:hypothetical protein